MYNNSMCSKGGKNVASGFTIIEVMLVLAITGFLFIGLMGGMSASLARQRYKDAVQDVADGFRRMYSFVVDAQVHERDNDSACYGLTSSAISGAGLTKNSGNTGRGRSDCLVYGIVATIANSHIEMTELIGKDFNVVRKEEEERPEEERINLDIANEMDVLKRTGVNNVVAFSDRTGSCSNIGLVNLIESFDSRWGTRILNTDGDDLEATIIVFRSPRSGAIRTYVMDGIVKIDNKPINYESFRGENHPCTDTLVIDQYGINNLLNSDAFSEKELNICVDSGDTAAYEGRRRMIQIVKGSHSSSGVALIDFDDEELNKCN